MVHLTVAAVGIVDDLYQVIFDALRQHLIHVALGVGAIHAELRSGHRATDASRSVPESAHYGVYIVGLASQTSLQAKVLH